MPSLREIVTNWIHSAIEGLMVVAFVAAIWIIIVLAFSI